MRIHFHGGADTVTGSQHIVEANGHRVLRDCGLFQGRRAEAANINRVLPFIPTELDSVLISHAHIDHCGNVPTLVAAGYEGPIHATSATVALAEIMLLDAARIQEQDAAYLNQKTNRMGLEPVVPLYTTRGAERALGLFSAHRYAETHEIAPGIEADYREAGHILGAALTTFTVRENGRATRVGFAVDLGRKNLPLIRDPEYLENIDALVMESTYGDRLHDDATRAEEQLREVVQRTYDRGGKVIIPSFALERAQELIYHLNVLIAGKRLPRHTVYVDSPMAAAVTRVFDEQAATLDEESRRHQAEFGCLMCSDWVRFVSSVEESKAVTAAPGPCIVIAASGMCEHGRILHHLKHGIGDPKNTIVIVGFQAEHTLGRRLVEKADQVRIFGDLFKREADVKVLNAFSAHADRNDLVDYVRITRPKKVFLVHGEQKQRDALAQALRDEKLADVFLPLRGDSVEL